MKITKITLAAPRFQSDLNRTQSPAPLLKTQRNDDDIQEVLEMEERPMNVYHNPSIAPKGTSLPRRCN